MSASNNTNFKKLAAEADCAREKDLKTRQETQRLKVELDQQNNEDDSNERSSNSGVTDVSSTYGSSRTSSVEPAVLEQRLRLLEAENHGYKLKNRELEESTQLLSYQVNLIRDQLEDLTYSLTMTQQELTEKKRLSSYQKNQIDDLTKRIHFLSNQVEIRDNLIKDNNLMLFDEPAYVEGDDNTTTTTGGGGGADSNGDNVLSNGLEHNSTISGAALLSKDTVSMLKELMENNLETCIKTLFDERQKHLDEIKALKRQIADSKDDLQNNNRKDSKSKQNGDDYDNLKQNFQNAKSQAQEYKRQLQLSQQKVNSLEADIKTNETKIIRLEGQVKRHKLIAETCEKQESELKQSKRKSQKELREAQNTIEDLKSENQSLLKKLDKFTKQKAKKQDS